MSAPSLSPIPAFGTASVFDDQGTFVGNFGSIGAAITAAAAGQTVLVGPGFFIENVVVDKPLTLISSGGRDATTIIGVSGQGALGAVTVTTGVDGLTIGGDGCGFTIVGIDNGNPAIENAAIYLQGSQDDLTIRGNEIVANGDAGLTSEFGGALTNATIDGNIFSGQTFIGANPAGNGFGGQFTDANVPRQLVVLGEGNGPYISTDVTFTNNQITGRTGGISTTDAPAEQGNTMVTIDVPGSTISDNVFTGEAARFATALRARGPNIDVENNSFDNSFGGDTRGVFIDAKGQPGAYAGNTFTGGAEGDQFAGTPGDDAMTGGGGNDTFIGGAGDDTIDGGAGGDQLVLGGARGDYAVTKTGPGAYVVTGPDGTDAVAGVEQLTFLGGGAPLELDVNSPDYAAAFTRFEQGFEDGFAGFLDETGGWAGSVTLLPTGTDGIDSAIGVSHARFEQTTTDVGLTGPFSRLGGYRSELGDGLITQVRIYLDPAALAAGEGFDMSAAAMTSAGGFLRDFIFHVTKDTSTGQLLVGASNNTGFDPREDLETINSVAVETAGWHTFEYKFYPNETGDLEVALNLYNPSGDWLFTEIRSNPADDAGTVAGGNRYLWFTNIDVAGGILVDGVSMATLDANPIQLLRANIIIDTFPTVAEAVAAAQPDDVIDLAAGDYTSQSPVSVDVGDLTFRGGANVTGLSVALLPGAANVTLDGAMDADATAADGAFNTIVGSVGANVIATGDGDDVLTGGGGDDTLDGGDDIDTARYAGDRADHTVAAVMGADGRVTGFTAVTDNNATEGDEGADTLISIEVLEFGDIVLDTTQPVQVFDALGALAGTFDTIQAGVNAASAGDTIIVAAGIYDENVVITKPLSIIGAGVDQTVVAPASGTAFSVSGDITAAATAASVASLVAIAGVEIDGATGSGVRVASTTVLGELSVTDSDIADNGVHGVGVLSSQVGLVTIADTDFADNGQGGSNGSGDIVLFNYLGDAAISDVVIASSRVAGDATASKGDNAIQIAGFDPATYDVSNPLGTVSLTNVSVTGAYHKPHLAIQGYTDLSGASFANVSLDGAAEWGFLVFIDPVASPGTDTQGVSGYPGFFAGGAATSTLDLSGVTVVNASPGATADVVVRGTDADDVTTGTEARDVLNAPAEENIDYGGGDHLRGLGGDDTLTGGAGDDTLDGGEGFDTAVYAGNIADYTIVPVTDANGAVIDFASVTDNNTGDGDEGTDTLTSIERLVFADAELTVDDPVLLFDGGGSLVASFATIQAAVDAASDGFTVRVAAGTYDEDVVVDVDLTILGANAGVGADDEGRDAAESVIVGGVRFAPGADGSTLDGVRIEDGATALGETAGVYVQADDVTVTNSVIVRDGGFGAARGLVTATGSVLGLSVTGNAFTGWATGAYLNPGAGATVTGNRFEANNVGLSIDDPTANSDVSGNDFVDNVVEQIGVGLPQDGIDASDAIGLNAFTGAAPQVSLFPLIAGGALSFGGTVNDDVFNGDADGETTFSFTGGAGDDVMVGAAVVAGGVLTGGDVFHFTGPQSNYTVGAGVDPLLGRPTLVVTDIVGGDATNYLVGVEAATFAGGPAIRVFGGADTVMTTAGVALVVDTDDLLANDVDVRLDPLRVSSVANGVGGTVALNDGGTAGDFSDDSVTFTPDAGFSGQGSFFYTASDGFGGAAVFEVAVDVEPSGQVNTVLVNLAGQGPESTPPLFNIIVDGVVFGPFAVNDPAQSTAGRVYEDYIVTVADAAPSNVGVQFINDSVVEGINLNLYVDYIEVNGERYESEIDGNYIRANGKVVGPTENLFNNGALVFEDLNPPPPTSVTVVARIAGTGTEAAPPTFTVAINGEEQGQFAVSNPAAKPSARTFEDFVFIIDDASDFDVAITFNNDGSTDGVNRNLYVDYVEIDGQRFEAEIDGNYIRTSGKVVGATESLFNNGTLFFDDLMLA